MNFQGLQNGLPFIVTVIVTIAICILVWASYRKYSSIPRSSKILLSSLRAISLILLFILLMNPFFKKEEDIIVKPKVALLFDGSQSVAIDKGKYNGMTSYNEVIASLKNAPNDVVIDFYKFGGNIQSTDASNFDANLPSTNIFNALENIITSDNDYVFASIISDGIITIGKNPVIESSNSPFPIHTIAVGDTNNVKDVSISNINTNSTGFTNTVQKISTDISHFGYDGSTVNVSLLNGDELLNEQTVTLFKDRKIETIEFEMELKSAGLKQYRVKVELLADEWIRENNEATFSIEVLDSKKRILHIASEVHPDVKMIRSILATDENIELSTYTILGNNRISKKIIANNKYDLVIMHGSIQPNVLTELEIEVIETPTLYMPLYNSFISISTEGQYKLITSDEIQLYNVHVYISNEQADHPVLELPEVDLSAFPPLKGSVSSRQINSEASTLLTSSFQNINTNAPLISILEIGNVRRSEVHAFGWYKSYLSPNKQERDFIITLFSNLVDWTSSNPDNRLLKIKPVKNIFNSGEDIIVNGSLINENGSIESSAIVEVNIEGENFSSDFTMNNLGNGNYQLQAPALPDGAYKFLAVARKGSREIDVQSGEFLVSQSNIELSNTIRNDNLLKGISANSGGIFLTYEDASNFWDLDDVIKMLKTKVELREEYVFPVRSVLWFIIVILLLTGEWLLRKKYALP